MSKITAREGEIDDYRYAVLQPFGRHYCAYVGVPKNHPMENIHWTALYDLGLNSPAVNGGLSFSGVPDGLENHTGYTWFGWDYNHSWDKHNHHYPNGEKDSNVEWYADAPDEDVIMGEIKSCIEWMNDATGKLARGEVSHHDCPRCQNEKVAKDSLIDFSAL